MTDLQAAIEGLREIAELTARQQLPITAQIHRVAVETLYAVGYGLTRDSGRLPKGEDSRSEAECEASQSGAEGNRPNTSGQPT